MPYSKGLSRLQRGGKPDFPGQALAVDRSFRDVRPRLRWFGITGAQETLGLARLRFDKKNVALPRSRVGRISLGAVLILGGMLGFLPLLGYWTIPLGPIALAEDFPVVRR